MNVKCQFCTATCDKPRTIQFEDTLALTPAVSPSLREDATARQARRGRIFGSLGWHALLILMCGISLTSPAQTRIKISAIKPGTEQVQLVPNGDFQFQGPLVSGNYPIPTGWNRIGDAFANSGSNMAPVNLGVVAKGNVDGGAGVGGFTETVTLEANTAYVFSAYLWNFGDAINHVTTVIDFNDVAGEPQVTLGSTDSEADKGYFVYRSFNTSTTGTNILIRAFYDGLAGTGTAASYYPVAAQWDNFAITKSANFVAPQASNSTATLRPIVRITNPANNSSVALTNASPNLVISADASDLDGTVTNVAFYAGTNKVAATSSGPWNGTWTNVSAGNYILTAMAADNTGATTVSAPVSISISVVPAQLSIAQIYIARAGTNVLLYWATNSLPAIVQAASNITPVMVWRTSTNPIVLSNGVNTVIRAAVKPKELFRLAGEVDPSTMNHKLLMGYQGWFACPGDGSAPNSWIHWFRNNSPTPTNATIDLWPDTTELDPDELFATSMTYSNGSPAKLYSAYKAKTVLRHFKWMADNHLDGVFFQRFLSDLSGSTLSLRNQVASNVRAGAEAYSRVFAIMYDISGYPTNSLISALTNDWNYLVSTQHVTNSPNYLHHKGKPVVAIWGFGFSGRSDTPAQAQEAIAWFKGAGCTVMGGVPSYWRTLTADAQSNPAWSNAFRSFDVISPWAVGRYSDNAGADTYRTSVTVPDLADCVAHRVDYLPVIFPGFSWTNLNGGPYNQIPRNGGNFYWRQVYNGLRSGCSMIYGAMFDEVDEGTAMFKIAPNAGAQPAQGNWVPLNADGYTLPSDWYLQLANYAGKMLRGEIPLQSTLPISP